MNKLGYVIGIIIAIPLMAIVMVYEFVLIVLVSIFKAITKFALALIKFFLSLSLLPAIKEWLDRNKK